MKERRRRKEKRSSLHSLLFSSDLVSHSLSLTLFTGLLRFTRRAERNPRTETATMSSPIFPTLLSLSSQDKPACSRTLVNQQLSVLEVELVNTLCDCNARISSYSLLSSAIPSLVETLEELSCTIEHVKVYLLHIMELQTPDRWIEASGLCLSSPSSSSSSSHLPTLVCLSVCLFV